MELNSMENLIHLPIYENVTKRYGKYTKKINGELVKVIYDWYERENGIQYKLDLTKQQYDQMKSLVSPIDTYGNSLTFDQFCDILISVLTTSKNDYHNDYSIWLAFNSFDKNHNGYIEINELEILMEIISKNINREQIKYLINKINSNHNDKLDYNKFRQFIIRGYARELLMTDITKEIIYSNDKMNILNKN